MKPSLLIVLFLFFFSVSSKAQDRFAIGGMLGGIYYIGEYNPYGIPFYRSFIYGGGIINYSFNEFYDLKVNMSAGKLYGNSDPFYYEDKKGHFSQLLLDISVKGIFGFMPYDPFEKRRGEHYVQPYFTLGVGVFSVNKGSIMIPMGIGVKYRLAPRWTLTGEWIFNKTFIDDIDPVVGAVVAPVNRPFNTDWYSYAGISITYQLKEQCDCPGTIKRVPKYKDSNVYEKKK